MAKTKEVTIPMDKEDDSGGGSRFRVPEGDYPVKITGAKFTRSSKKQTPGLEVHYVITEGKHKGKKFDDTCWFSPKALWRVRALLEAVGISVPSKAFKLDVTKLKGKELGVTLTDDESSYEKDGQTKTSIRSQIAEFLDSDTLSSGRIEDEEDDDEELDDDVEDDDDEDDDDDPLADLDKDDLKKYIKKNKLEVKVKKSDDADSLREKVREAIDEDDDDDLEELDVDDDL